MGEKEATGDTRDTGARVSDVSAVSYGMEDTSLADSLSQLATVPGVKANPLISMKGVRFSNKTKVFNKQLSSYCDNGQTTS